MAGVQGWSPERLLVTIAVLPVMGSRINGPEEKSNNAGEEPSHRSGLCVDLWSFLSTWGWTLHGHFLPPTRSGWAHLLKAQCQSDKLDKTYQQAGVPKRSQGAMSDISGLPLSCRHNVPVRGLPLPALKCQALLHIKHPPCPLSSQLLLFYWSSCGNEILP